MQMSSNVSNVHLDGSVIKNINGRHGVSSSSLTRLFSGKVFENNTFLTKRSGTRFYRKFKICFNS
jgi:hypothetical protein